MKRILICLLALIGSSCEKAFISSIPDYPVYLELDLDFEDNALLTPLAYKIYTPQNVNQAVERTGFGGVLVFRGLGNTGTNACYAFDTACPYEASRSVTVGVDDAHLYALCDKCQTKYDLTSGAANPVSGPGREPLKPYRVWSNGNKIYVGNR
ncbi:MAG: (2Fe-2S)-binding protein [Tannerellaceae bacterium]|jgi:nitrite reductase/ring-hydroxylating ferredoxin subunit|nr:(2Fe-2S)-binding protein [Tannerellaceae bacterium]